MIRRLRAKKFAMKRLLVLLLCLTAVAEATARQRIFCEIIEEIRSTKKTRIYLDYGQPRTSKKHLRIQDAEGDAVIFSSRVEALNILAGLGWEFEQAYVKVDGNSTNGTGTTRSTTHYLMSKEVDSPAEIEHLAEAVEKRKAELRAAETQP